MQLLNDFQTSVRAAFDEIDPKWESYDGLVICGTHLPRGWNEQIELIKEAREIRKPTLGICYGLQLMAIEYARNVLGIKNATSEEFGEEGEFVVQKLRKLHVGLDRGESYWHNYTVRPDILEKMKDIDHPFYVGVQFHPEYESRIDKPHSLLVKFIEACKK